MMRSAAWLAERLAGPWLKSLVLPALILGLITAAHQYTRARADAASAKEAAAVMRGRSQCLAEVQLAQTQAELEAERKKVLLARAEAAEARSVATAVGEHIDDLEKRVREAEAAAPGSNPGCLSDGMRERLWGKAGGAGGAGPGGGGGAGRTGSRTP